MSTIYILEMFTLYIRNLSHILIFIQTSNSHPRNPEEPAWRFTTSYFIDGPALKRLHLIKSEEPAWRFTTSYFIDGAALKSLHLIKKKQRGTS